uniref:hypothetical protein n=1 Tax=Vibrio jasicida TaxID=766224 RepID=UPI0015E36B14|nr:hypothetical protein [Vibrio jasicida]
MGSFVVSYLKGTDFDEVSDEELARIEHILNTRGRESLGFYSLYDIFMQPRGGVLRFMWRKGPFKSESVQFSAPMWQLVMS